MKLEDLAAVIASTVKGVRPAKPALRLVQPPSPVVFDEITRTCVLDRIRSLKRMWQLGWLVDQATFNKPGVDVLRDEELSALLKDMERARECIQEGVSFADAGLVRNLADELPEPDYWR